MILQTKASFKSPFKSNRLVLREAPTAVIVKHMEMTKKLNQSKTQESEIDVSFVDINLHTEFKL